MRQMRYQYYSQDGIKWTKWFDWNYSVEKKWQMQGKLLNEYRDKPEDSNQ